MKINNLTKLSLVRSPFIAQISSLRVYSVGCLLGAGGLTKLSIIRGSSSGSFKNTNTLLICGKRFLSSFPMTRNIKINSTTDNIVLNEYGIAVLEFPNIADEFKDMEDKLKNPNPDYSEVSNYRKESFKLLKILEPGRYLIIPCFYLKQSIYMNEVYTYDYASRDSLSLVYGTFGYKRCANFLYEKDKNLNSDQDYEDSLILYFDAIMSLCNIFKTKFDERTEDFDLHKDFILLIIKLTKKTDFYPFTSDPFASVDTNKTKSYTSSSNYSTISKIVYSPNSLTSPRSSEARFTVLSKCSAGFGSIMNNVNTALSSRIINNKLNVSGIRKYSTYSKGYPFLFPEELMINSTPNKIKFDKNNLAVIRLPKYLDYFGENKEFRRDSIKTFLSLETGTYLTYCLFYMEKINYNKKVYNYSSFEHNNLILDSDSFGFLACTELLFNIRKKLSYTASVRRHNECLLLLDEVICKYDCYDINMSVEVILIIKKVDSKQPYLHKPFNYVKIISFKPSRGINWVIDPIYTTLSLNRLSKHSFSTLPQMKNLSRKGFSSHPAIIKYNLTKLSLNRPAAIATSISPGFTFLSLISHKKVAFYSSMSKNHTLIESDGGTTKTDKSRASTVKNSKIKSRPATNLGYTTGYFTKICKYTIKFPNKARHFSTKPVFYKNLGKFEQAVVTIPTDNLNYIDCDSYLNTKASHKYRNLDYVIHKTIDEVSIKTAMNNFAKAAVNDKLVGVIFYDYKTISLFLKNFKPSFQVSKQSLSNYKKRKFVFKSIIITKEVIYFMDYVKRFFPYFDDKAFLSLSKKIVPEKIKNTQLRLGGSN